ncbi:nicotinate phosphoribosyltransferase [Candidatus Woesearchaeota archaeon]|nr:nicotinate phosphoribosyltransferase [Candidatus Woesearchaeota archaeon]
MSKALLTDLYQLTMNAAYAESSKDDRATFELFIRHLPTDWGYFIANGIEDAIDDAMNLRFSDDDLAYLRSQNLFSNKYLETLRTFQFTGDINAVREGTPVTANTPIIQVAAPRTQGQLLETMLLNTINFQTMIASKASRIVHAAHGSRVVDFGLRRAHEEDAGMKGARAAYISGAAATSNVKAGMVYGIPITGTHAHSFVMSYPSELDAFRAYVATFPNKPTLLIDTYDTILGAEYAAIVGKEMEQRGLQLGAVRLDSGNLLELSKKVRALLDARGLTSVSIIASNDLNEYKINELLMQGAPINGFGVGTELITAKPVAAISGVYKLVEDGNGAKMKRSAEKTTYPGTKQVYRLADHDVLALSHERMDGIPLLEAVVRNGERVRQRPSLHDIRDYSLLCVSRLSETVKQVHAVPYAMICSQSLLDLSRRITGGAP